MVQEYLKNCLSRNVHAYMRMTNSLANCSLSTSSRVPMVQSPAIKMRVRNWSSGGLMSMSGSARRSFRYERTKPNCSSRNRESQSIKMYDLYLLRHFACRGSCRGSSTRPPLKMRMLVWTWTSLYTCRNWKRYASYICFLRCASFFYNNWGLTLKEICFSPTDQCCWWSSAECKLPPYSVLWCRTLQAAHLLPTGIDPFYFIIIFSLNSFHLLLFLWGRGLLPQMDNRADGLSCWHVAAWFHTFYTSQCRGNWPWSIISY